MIALGVMMTGVLLVALLVPGRGTRRLSWLFLVPTLLLAGLGGGGVVSPNFTLSLAEVPPSMGGAAGGALQTGQRIGSAIGAALLMTVYQRHARRRRDLRPAPACVRAAHALRGARPRAGDGRP